MKRQQTITKQSERLKGSNGASNGLESNPVSLPYLTGKLKDILDFEPENKTASYATAQINACLALLRVMKFDKEGNKQGTLDELIALAKRATSETRRLKDKEKTMHKISTGLTQPLSTGTGSKQLARTSEPVDRAGEQGSLSHEGGEALGGVPSMTQYPSSLRLTKRERVEDLGVVIEKSVGEWVKEERDSYGISKAPGIDKIPELV